MGNDGRGKDDLGMPREERIGEAPAAVPLTREFPPTDAELELLDKLRRAEHTGIDSLMLAVMNGRDINKPFVINACLDLIQHVRRLEQQSGAVSQNASRQIATTTERIAKLEKAVDEEFETINKQHIENVAKIIQRVDDIAKILSDTIQWLGLAWSKRTRSSLPKMPEPSAVTKAQVGGGAP